MNDLRQLMVKYYRENNRDIHRMSDYEVDNAIKFMIDNHTLVANTLNRFQPEDADPL